MSQPMRKMRTVPLTEFEGQTADLVREAQTSPEPLVITRGGNRLAVVLSPDTFDRMVAEAERLRLQKAVEEADLEMDGGEFIENADVLAELDDWVHRAS